MFELGAVPWRNEGSMNTPKSRGFQMPAEWHPHRRCWMTWPTYASANYGRLEARKVVWANVARTISRFEPVVMLANEADLVMARTLCGPAVEVRPVPIDDGWFRDNGPTFVIDGRGSLLGIDWDFNGWGGRVPFTNDRMAATEILEQEQIERVAAPLVLEGGSFHVDGEGTVMVTEECLLNPNRNPQLNRSAIETHLKDFLGVETVIWLNGGLKDDVTDGHVDQLAAFASPGVVFALTSEDETDVNYAALRENLEILRSARDARGRSLEIIEIPQPPALYNEHTGTRVSLSHINYYTANGGIVLPMFGFPDHDRRVLEIFREVFSDRDVVPVSSLEIAFAGGNIHCITQQEPVAASLSVRTPL
jgi:agmatine deiminase